FGVVALIGGPVRGPARPRSHADLARHGPLRRAGLLVVGARHDRRISTPSTPARAGRPGSQCARWTTAGFDEDRTPLLSIGVSRANCRSGLAGLLRRRAGPLVVARRRLCAARRVVGLAVRVILRPVRAAVRRTVLVLGLADP